MTPKGRVIQIKLWGTLPYITKDDLQRVIEDSPDESVPGRSGLIVETPTAARVCRNQYSSVQLLGQRMSIFDGGPVLYGSARSPTQFVMYKENVVAATQVADAPEGGSM